MYGFDSDRLDWNFANLQAAVYNTAFGATKAKSAKEFLLAFDSEKDTDGDEFFGRLKLFAAQHNALVNR